MRLTNPKDFKKCFQAGKRTNNKVFSLYYLENGGLPGRLGVNIAKSKINKAVDRNKIKRVAREVFRKGNFMGLDIVLLLKNEKNYWYQYFFHTKRGFNSLTKNRNEILLMVVLKPDLAVLDETDSGLDIDALKTVSNGVNAFRDSSNGVLLITHYQRLLDYVVPDFVHVLSEGKIIQSGDKSLALELESKGYAWLT